MELPLKSKAAIVTGAGRGIGRAIALRLAELGADIVVVSRTQQELDRLAGEIGAVGRRAAAVAADISREPDVNTIVRTAMDAFGRIDILVNNAGIGTFAPVAELKVGDFDRMWSVNVRGAFLCTQAVLPAMIRQHAGDVVNIASLAGRNAFTGGAGYAATKWALIGFARCLMLEVRQHDIRVMTICPGSVETTFGDHAGAVPKSGGIIPTAADIATVTCDTLCMPRHVMVSEVDVRPTNPKH